MFMDHKTQYCLAVSLLRIVYGFSANSLKIPTAIFVEIDKLFATCIWKCIQLRIVNATEN
jgi:hypothetical protein